jgi:hypothetical protein
MSHARHRVRPADAEFIARFVEKWAGVELSGRDAACLSAATERQSTYTLLTTEIRTHFVSGGIIYI